MAKDNAAERAEQEADAEGGKRGEGPHCRADLREKFPVKYQRGGDTVEKKVVPVDHGPGEAAPGRSAGAVE